MRVIVLSSCAAVSNSSTQEPMNESCWNTDNIEDIKLKGRNAPQAAKYRASKSLAERGMVTFKLKLKTVYTSFYIAAWNFVENHKTEIGWDLVTLCPPYVCV